MDPTRTPMEFARLPEYAARQEPAHHATPHKQVFHNSKVAIGNWVHFAAALAPLIIGECIKDPEKRWRYTRLSAAGFALASGMLWRDYVKREKERDQERER